MDKPFAITTEDGFVLTFLAAWISIRVATWGIESPKPLFILILGIFVVCALVSQYRHWLFFRSKQLGLIAGLSIPGAILIAVYFSAVNPNYLARLDWTVFGALLFLWIIMPLLEYIGNKFSLSVNKNDARAVPESTSAPAAAAQEIKPPA